jgi:hypothetical protein
MAKLIVLGSDGRKEHELGAVTTIGRHPDNVVQILDRIVSKEHAQIIRSPAASSSTATSAASMAPSCAASACPSTCWWRATRSSSAAPS